MQQIIATSRARIDTDVPYAFVEARDGTPIAWQSHGASEGPTLVLTNGYSTSSFYWRHLIERFAPRVRLVTWDLKGHGASGAACGPQGCAMPELVDDLRRVMDAAGVERATLVGFSMGCQIVLEAWRHMPQRIAAIVPVLGTYGRPFDTLLHPRVGRLAARLFERLGPRLGPGSLRATAAVMRTGLGHRLNVLGGMVGRGVERSTMRSFYEHLGAIDGPTWVAMGIAAQQHTAADLLEHIDVPVLVVSGGRDRMTPHAVSVEMARRLPRGEHLSLPHASHVGLYEYPDVIGDALEDFMRRHALG